MTKAIELTGHDLTNHIDLHVALKLVDVQGDRVIAGRPEAAGSARRPE